MPFTSCCGRPSRQDFCTLALLLRQVRMPPEILLVLPQLLIVPRLRTLSISNGRSSAIQTQRPRTFAFHQRLHRSRTITTLLGMMRGEQAVVDTGFLSDYCNDSLFPSHLTGKNVLLHIAHASIEAPQQGPSKPPIRIHRTVADHQRKPKVTIKPCLYHER